MLALLSLPLRDEVTHVGLHVLVFVEMLIVHFLLVIELFAIFSAEELRTVIGGSRHFKRVVALEVP